MRRALLSFVASMTIFVTAPRAAEADVPFGRDKAVHFAVELGLTTLSYGIAAEILESRALRLVIGGAVGVAAGVGKELLDLTGFGEPEWLDLAFGLLGVATGLLIAWSIDAIAGRARRERRLAGP